MAIRIRLGLALMLLVAAWPASARWREASSEHFLIYSEQPPEQLRSFAAKLERFDAGLRLIAGIPPYEGGKANRLTVYVMGLGKVQQLYRQNGTATVNIGGFYLPRAGNSLAFVSTGIGSGPLDLDAQTVLFHEYTHHVMLENSLAAYPAWYAEGFAEFCATAKIEDDGSGGFGYPAMHRAWGLFNNEQQLSVRALFGAMPVQLTAAQRESLYGRGWLLTHYLTFATERRGQLKAYLDAINAGLPGLQAAAVAFGDVGKLERELGQYLTQQKLSYFPLAAAQLGNPAVTVRELSDGEDAIIPVRIRSQRGVSDRVVKAILADARKVAAGYPADPAVQVALAEAELDAGNSADADAAADRALQADPNSVRAMIYKSRIALRQPRRDPAAARSWAVKANRIDANDPRPLLLFYQSFAAADSPPSASAVDGLARAFELAPQDRDLLYAQTRQLLVEHKWREARRMFAVVAYSPHGGPIAARAAAFIERIDSGRTDGLLQDFERPLSGVELKG